MPQIPPAKPDAAPASAPFSRVDWTWMPGRKIIVVTAADRTAPRMNWDCIGSATRRIAAPKGLARGPWRNAGSCRRRASGDWRSAGPSADRRTQADEEGRRQPKGQRIRSPSGRQRQSDGEGTEPPIRAGTKQARVIDLLCRPHGPAAPPDPSDHRGGDEAEEELGFTVTSQKTESGGRRYQIAE